MMSSVKYTFIVPKILPAGHVSSYIEQSIAFLSLVRPSVGGKQLPTLPLIYV